MARGLGLPSIKPRSRKLHDELTHFNGLFPAREKLSWLRLSAILLAPAADSLIYLCSLRSLARRNLPKAKQPRSLSLFCFPRLSGLSAKSTKRPSIGTYSAAYGRTR